MAQSTGTQPAGTQHPTGGTTRPLVTVNLQLLLSHIETNSQITNQLTKSQVEDRAVVTRRAARMGQTTGEIFKLATCPTKIPESGIHPSETIS